MVGSRDEKDRHGKTEREKKKKKSGQERRSEEK
jgi:hypothetical protein